MLDEEEEEEEEEKEEVKLLVNATLSKAPFSVSRLVGAQVAPSTPQILLQCYFNATSMLLRGCPSKGVGDG